MLSTMAMLLEQCISLRDTDDDEFDPIIV